MTEIQFKTWKPVLPTDADLSRLEKKLGYALPKDFRDFLMATGTAQPVGHAVIRIEDCNEDAMLQVILGIDKDLSLLSQTTTLGDDLPEGFIIFATDPGGNKFLMDLSEGEPTPIYYWDRMRHFRRSKKKANTYEIAESFTQFLEKLRPMA